MFRQREEEREEIFSKIIGNKLISVTKNILKNN